MAKIFYVTETGDDYTTAHFFKTETEALKYGKSKVKDFEMKQDMWSDGYHDKENDTWFGGEWINTQYGILMSWEEDRVYIQSADDEEARKFLRSLKHDKKGSAFFFDSFKKGMYGSLGNDFAEGEGYTWKNHKKKYINESKTMSFINNKMANILAPFVKIEESLQFYLNGRTYEIKENNVEIIENPKNSNLLSAISAFESFEFLNETVRWYHGSSKFIYNIKEGKFYNNNTEILESFSNFALHSGLVRYENKNKAELFESLSTIIENFMIVDFATTYKRGGVTVDLFKLDENLFISRYNKDTKLSKFFSASANEAVEYIKAETSEDASSVVIEMLEGELAETAKKSEEISKYEDMISFLKDQRGLLAEADKSIEEIKEADSLINSEIKSWEEKIEALKA
jgi:hypothetical protein